MEGQKKRVIAALSGGVDSAVAATLLKEAGHQVTGVYIEVWQPPPEWGIPCTAEADRLEAMRVAAFLDIPFETVDFSDAYKKEVVDYMVAEYAAGRTPNPDVMCNRTVKFGALWAWASARGFDAIATGHYAEVREGPEGYELHAGADPQKDQSYFLWTLTEGDLAHILFPVGHLQKSEVREYARTHGLPNAARKDSQGLCFVGKLDMKDFLRHFIKAAPGTVLDESGAAIGTHDGALLYTEGERHGFYVEAKSPTDKPLYVVAKSVVDNTITVSPSPQESATMEGARLEHTSWVGTPPKADAVYGARVRYRQPLQQCRHDGERVAFAAAQTALPKGQSLVMYAGTRVLGGGRIA